MIKKLVILSIIATAVMVSTASAIFPVHLAERKARYNEARRKAEREAEILEVVRAELMRMELLKITEEAGGVTPKKQ